jgi:hypothetical protein
MYSVGVRHDLYVDDVQKHIHVCGKVNTRFRYAGFVEEVLLQVSWSFVRVPYQPEYSSDVMESILPSPKKDFCGGEDEAGCES